MTHPRTDSAPLPVPASESAPPRPGSGEFFDTIADRYDLLNRILSLGFDLRWRAHAVRTLALEPGRCVLDLATGTADLAIACALACPGIEVLGLDLSPRMLEIGARKVARRRLQSRIRLELGDAQRLDRLPDASFDAVTMAFGIRNLPDREAALREMRRVAKPGAPIAILELSEPRGGLFAPLARSHIHVLVPWVGGLLSGAEAYRYLQRSIAAFPPPEAIVAAMRKAGIEHPRAEPLTFGVCHLYVGRAGKGAPS